jgi:Spy/CpxP family protein refolding chaperone
MGGPRFLGGDGMKVMEALMELRTAATDPNATAEQIKDKTAVVRKAREKARENLVASQKDLLRLLTPDQEAVLVALGHLD